MLAIKGNRAVCPWALLQQVAMWQSRVGHRMRTAEGVGAFTPSLSKHTPRTFIAVWTTACVASVYIQCHHHREEKGPEWRLDPFTCYAGIDCACGLLGSKERDYI